MKGLFLQSILMASLLSNRSMMDELDGFRRNYREKDDTPKNKYNLSTEEIEQLEEMTPKQKKKFLKQRNVEKVVAGRMTDSINKKIEEQILGPDVVAYSTPQAQEALTIEKLLKVRDMLSNIPLASFKVRSLAHFQHSKLLGNFSQSENNTSMLAHIGMTLPDTLYGIKITEDTELNPGILEYYVNGQKMGRYFYE